MNGIVNDGGMFRSAAGSLSPAWANVVEVIWRRQVHLPLSEPRSFRRSLMEIASKTALEAYGMSYQDIESGGGKIFFLSLPTSLAMMKDGRVDAISVTVQFSQISITEAIGTLTRIARVFLTGGPSRRDSSHANTRSAIAPFMVATRNVTPYAPTRSLTWISVSTP